MASKATARQQDPFIPVTINGTPIVVTNGTPPTLTYRTVAGHDYTAPITAISNRTVHFNETSRVAHCRGCAHGQRIFALPACWMSEALAAGYAICEPDQSLLYE